MEETIVQTLYKTLIAMFITVIILCGVVIALILNDNNSKESVCSVNGGWNNLKLSKYNIEMDECNE